MSSWIDRYYGYIRPFRFLYAWAKDPATKAKSSARAAEWRARGFKDAKLDICGGRYPYKPGEFLNVDFVEFPAVDLAFDLRGEFPIPSNVVAEIISIATLEHFRKPDVEHILKECFRILKPGGTIRIATPDIEAIAAGVIRGDDSDVLNQQLFGRFKSDETSDLDVHRSMYRAREMIALLHQLGFQHGTQLPVGPDIPHDPRYTFLIGAEKPRA
jgi:predicted SAM-dependent methyltransferase